MARVADKYSFLNIASKSGDLAYKNSTNLHRQYSVGAVWSDLIDAEPPAVIRI